MQKTELFCKSLWKPVFHDPTALVLLLFAVFLEGCVFTPYPDTIPQGNTNSIRLSEFRFSRWDGGHIEVLKGQLTGWPYFVPPDPGILDATENLYNPASIDLITAGSLDWIWVTWSVGFSAQTEAAQQHLLLAYIAECHRRGIRVMAYISIANIFWEDMFANVPESRNWVLLQNGQPVPYPGADYGAVGHVTRYMADLRNPLWQSYVLARVRAAVQAGADAIIFDNNLAIYGRALLQQFTANALKAAQQVNPSVLMCSNYHFDLVIAARTENAISSEDGLEPGLFADAGPPADTWNSTPYFVDIAEGKLALNAGLLRALIGVSQGSRPVLLEYGNRHLGNRFVSLLSPRHEALALAETAAFHASMVQFHESKVLRDLVAGDPVAVRNWATVAQFNSFLNQNADLFGPVTSAARVAVVVEDTLNDVGFLNRLAAANIVYDVFFEEDMTPEVLARYAIVIAAPSASLEPGVRRAADVSVAELSAASLASLKAPETVLMNVQSQPERGLVVVHLLNYADTAAVNLQLSVKGIFTKAALLSPGNAPTSLALSSNGNASRLTIPSLDTYATVVLR